MLVLLPLVVLSLLVAWPRIRGLGRPEAPRTPADPVEQVATTYLEALVAGNPLVLNQLGTIAEPPAIRSFQRPRRDRGGDRDVRGSFAPIAALHARIDEDYTFDPKLGRFQPKNALGPAAETLDALHAAKAKMEREKVYEKMASADLDEVVDSVTAFGKVFSDMAEGTLAPAKLLPTYAQLVEQSKPPLPPDARELALDYADEPRELGRPAEAAILDAQGRRPLPPRTRRGDRPRLQRARFQRRPADHPPADPDPIPPRRDRHRLESHLGASRRGRRRAGPAAGFLGPRRAPIRPATSPHLRTRECNWRFRPSSWTPQLDARPSVG